MKKSGFIFLMVLVVAGLVIGYASQDNTKQDQPYKITVKKGKSHGRHDFVVYAWKGGYIEAAYYRNKNGTGTLNFDHKNFDDIFLQLDEFDKVTEVELNMQDFYYCSSGYNKTICKAAQNDANYWKSIMKWDKVVKKHLGLRRSIS